MLYKINTKYSYLGKQHKKDKNIYIYNHVNTLYIIATKVVRRFNYSQVGVGGENIRPRSL